MSEDDTTACTHPADGVLWNPWNRVIQCHRCGHVMDPETHAYDPWVTADKPDSVK